MRTAPFLLALALPCLGFASEIEVISAAYGLNCTANANDNLKDHVAASCNGRQTCNYGVSLRPLNNQDPAFGCHKEFTVTYSCKSETQPRTVKLEREALGKTATIDCSMVKAPSQTQSEPQPVAHSTRFWVGVVFGVVCLAFFMWAYKNPPDRRGQYDILRVLSAVFAGVAGLILSGDVFTQVSSNVTDAGKLTVSAAGATALFVLVWFTFPKPPQVTNAPGFNISFPPGTTFQAAARTIAVAARGSVSFVGFAPEELNTTLSFLDLRAADGEQAFASLRNLVAPDNVRKYSVQRSGSHYDLSIKDSAGAR